MGEQVDVVVIGAGQAGIAASEHLRAAGLRHVVLERGRIAQRWRSDRWDSLVTNGPAWHDRFPNLSFAGAGPDEFIGKEAVADYFVDYAAMIDAPVREGVTVTGVTRADGDERFHVTTSRAARDAGADASDGAGSGVGVGVGAGEASGAVAGDSYHPRHVIVATGAFQTPLAPALIPAGAGVHQIHSTGYRNPAALPPGAVVVVGAGSSGTQIAEELARSGRKVYLSVGPHERPPRRYRGRDFVWWLGVLNHWDAEAEPVADHVTIAVSGADGGHSIDFRRLAHETGIELMGRVEAFEDGRLRIADDLRRNLAQGDARYLALLADCDRYVARHGLDLPAEPSAHLIPADPASVRDPLTVLDLAAAGVSTVIWATGFTCDYSWIDLDITDGQGRPRHRRGVSPQSGLYFLGLPWQTRRGSSFIWGVWYDAKYIVDHIAKQQAYADYRPGEAAAPLAATA